MTTRVEYAENSVSDDELFGTYMVEFHEMTLTKSKITYWGQVWVHVQKHDRLWAYTRVWFCQNCPTPKISKCIFLSSLF